jgi:carboxymethylenebutenolidase
MSAITHEYVEVACGDATTMDCYLARPVHDRDAHAGVLLLQEIWGVNAHIRDVADRLARLGYTVIAPDVFHRTAPRFAATYDDLSGRDHAAKITADGLRADLDGAAGHLRSLLAESVDAPKLGAVGFCMGGRLAYLANAWLDLSCAASFYGGGIAGAHLDLAAVQRGPLLLFWAGRDRYISKDDRRAVADALEAAGKRFTEVNVGHADHGFFCDQRSSYDAEAAREAWGMLTQFLASNLG